MYKQILIEDSKETLVNETLSNGKMVTITSNPSGATLFIDEKKVGITPFKGIVSFGDHVVRATSKGFVDERKINVSEFKDETFQLNLGKYISIEADVKNCEVYINYQSVGSAPYKGIISSGIHNIKIVHNGLQFSKEINTEQYLNDIIITFDVNESVNIEKRSGPANLFLSVLVPGLGDWNVTKGKQSGINKMILTYGSIACGIGCKLLSDSEYEKYHLATEQTAMDKHYNNANLSNYGFYAFTAAGLAVWIHDIIWVAQKGTQNLRERKNSKLSLICDPGNQMIGVNYKIKF